MVAVRARFIGPTLQTDPVYVTKSGLKQSGAQVPVVSFGYLFIDGYNASDAGIRPGDSSDDESAVSAESDQGE